MEQSSGKQKRSDDYRPLADRLGSGRTDKGHSGRLSKRTHLADLLVRTVLFLCALVSVLTTIGFVVVLGDEASDFFTDTVWLEANKSLEDPATVDDTTLILKTSGLQVQEGMVLRLGSHDYDEQVRILEIVGEVEDDGEGLAEEGLIIEVERGVNGSEATEHGTTDPISIADDVTFVEFFTNTQWSPQIGEFGVLPLLSSTLRIAGIALLVAVPLGLAAAIYLSEYATRRTRGILKPILEILAGIPTVVYGYFALTLVTPLLRSLLGNDVVQIYNVASAGIVVGILIIPMISSISEDALSAVPDSLRRASYGMGATKLETIFRVLLPGALSGITASIILAMSRAVGETMIVLIAAGAGPKWTFNPFESAETMAGHIARISTGDLSRGSIDYNSLFAVGLTLFFMTLILNLISTLITRRFREVYS
jgi:phosphate transport system permease protein